MYNFSKYTHIMSILSSKSKVKEYILQKVVIKIAVPKDNEKQSESAVQLFQAIHGTLRNKMILEDHFSLELIGNGDGVFFIVVCEERYYKFVESQIYAAYPDSEITRINDYVNLDILKSFSIESSKLTLKKPSYLPIKTYDRFNTDPIAPLISVISKLPATQSAWIQILIRPVSNSISELGKRYIKRISKTVNEQGKEVSLSLDNDQREEIRQIENRSNSDGFQFLIRILTIAGTTSDANYALEDIEASFNQFDSSKLNGFKEKIDKKGFLGELIGNEDLTIESRYLNRFLDDNEKGILNTQETASVFHLPNKSVKITQLNWSSSTKLQVPNDLPVINTQIDLNHNNFDIKYSSEFLHTGVRYFGLTDYRNNHFPFGIKREDRRRHMYLLGKTGTGKSLFIKNMVFDDLYDGEGFAVIDPHGDLVEEILELIPEHRKNDVVYLDPSDIDNPIGLNMLDIKEGESKELLADGIVSVFIKLFGHSWGPRLQHILHNTVLTLLHCQNVSLLAVQRILLDGNYRKFLLNHYYLT
ncbi:MAG: DUF87 domain-containing protein [Candidatus Dojkabacteria bacterium]|nr:DUF87 domain-containing protein [Candidatus Dojkabacteria bacterium]MDQ7021440.1 DUF87 domain-containing protein [Candidatus Dojkabacteria bacterium]